jgi:hypothetical protein
VPTLQQFALRFLDGPARANQQKPGGIAHKETVLKVHLVPQLGVKRLDGLPTEDVLHLRRSSDTIIAWSSSDHVTWTKLGTVNVSMAADVFVGLAVTRHDTATTAQAVFDDVLIVQ